MCEQYCDSFILFLSFRAHARNLEHSLTTLQIPRMRSE